MNLQELLDGLNAPDALTKYGCAKVLRNLAAEQPKLLYPHFDYFHRLLRHPNKIFQWQGSFVLSHLARVDTERKFDEIFEEYFRPVRGPVMITAANVIGGAARIALARPDLADRIALEILKVSRARYQTTECRNVAIAHAVRAFDGILELLRNPEPVFRFVRRQLRNPRPAARKAAEHFLQRRSRRVNGRSPD